MIAKKISQEIIEIMKKEIKNGNDNEVFFKGEVNDKGVINIVEVLARGNKNSVAAIISRISAGNVVIHNHPSGDLTPSGADITLSSIIGNIGCGSYIVNNDISEFYVLCEPEIIKKIDINIEKLFSKDSKIKNVFDDFEFRNEQHEMAQFVMEGIEKDKKVIIEAGTGTGKTLAYLIPSISWALSNKKKIVISTNTINLQEQLIKKDIPLVKKILDVKFQVELVKGRNNYVCLRKMKNIAQTDVAQFSNSQIMELNNLISYINETKVGVKQDFNLMPSISVWILINCEADLCKGMKCQYFEECFFQIQRTKLIYADILVVNHHLFFADTKIRSMVGFDTEFSILPNYGMLILDEAHNIENTARDYFSYEISKYGTMRLLNSIYNYSIKNKQSGSIIKVLDYLENNYPEIYNKFLDQFENKIIDLHKKVYELSNDFFTKFIKIFSDEKNSQKIRITPNFLKENFQLNDIFIKDTLILLEQLAQYKKVLNSSIKILSESEIDDNNGIIFDFLRYVDRIKELQENLKFVTFVVNPGFVYWLEINEKKNNVKVGATPIDISKSLEEVLYKNINKIVFTSATLAVKNSFEYFKNSVGILSENIEKIIKSPFDYKKQREVFIISKLCEPSDKEFYTDIVDVISETIKKTDGNTFVLFTSYFGLNRVFNSIRTKFMNSDYNFFIQGEFPRHKLLELYKNCEKPVLFATDSFWEGVDVKGKKLSSVIIVKLPFKVPSEPIVEAIIEKIKKEGGNPFMEYQIPQAVIKFKQGIGRLIRSKTDVGQITVLDTRIIKKRYGKLFRDVFEDSKINIK